MKRIRNNKNNKIRMIDYVSDLALATIILGILLFFGMAHGIVFIADGVLLALFCFLVATTNPLADSFTALRIYALFCALLAVIVLITCAALGCGAAGSVVSFAGLVISGLIAHLIVKLRTGAERMARSQAYNVVNGLKKVG